MKLNRVLRMTAVFLLIAGCSGGGGGGSTGPGVNPSPAPPPAPPPPPPPPSSGSNTIEVANNTYTPSAKTVTAGTTVNWTWNTCTGTAGYDESCVAHTVTFDDGVTSGQQEKGSFSRTFTTTGTYAYHCLIHGNKMAGTITVQ